MLTSDGGGYDKGGVVQVHSRLYKDSEVVLLPGTKDPTPVQIFLFFLES